MTELQPMLGERNSPPETPVSSTQNGRVRIDPAQPAPPGLAHQKEYWSMSMENSLLTNQKHPGS